MESTGDEMDIRKSSLVLVCACLLLDVLIPNIYVHAETPSFVEIPLEAFHDEKPLELQGLISSQTINIPIPGKLAGQRRQLAGDKSQDQPSAGFSEVVNDDFAQWSADQFYDTYKHTQSQA